MVRGGRSNSSLLPGAGLDLSDMSSLADRLRRAEGVAQLSAELGMIARELGFPFHALTHHADVARPPPRFMFVQNYPAGWVQTYAHGGLHRHDPTRRLASVRPASFVWSDLARLMPLSTSEERLLDAARRAGLAGGFTVPLHTAGERTASCSFALERGQPLPTSFLPAAEFLAHVAFGALFDLLHPDRTREVPRLTPRQEECVELMARGKTNWEIGAILGLAEGTVKNYLASARQAIGAARRTQLAMAAASLGLIGFDEIAPRQ